jgi:hypothetical protein
MESVDRRSDWSGMMFEVDPPRILQDRPGRPEASAKRRTLILSMAYLYSGNNHELWVCAKFALS